VLAAPFGRSGEATKFGRLALLGRVHRVLRRRIDISVFDQTLHPVAPASTTIAPPARPRGFGLRAGGVFAEHPDMSDESKRIIVDDDWKAEAQREKERLAKEAEAARGPRPAGGFVELLNVLGGFAGPGGEPIPPNLEAAKHFIDLLRVLEEKTQGNLSDDEKKMLDQTLYELQMRFVQMAQLANSAASPTDLPGMGVPRA
jgi:hypothetical protein